MTKRKLYLYLLLSMLASVPIVKGNLQFGPDSGEGSVTLTNPDGSQYFFTSANMSLYNYATNTPDGWWIFNPTTALNAEDTSDYWVLGVVFGIIALTVATALVLTVRRK